MKRTGLRLSFTSISPRARIACFGRRHSRQTLGRRLSAPTDRARVSAILRRLRAEVGDIEFGYRAQGLFAHVLKQIGASVVEVKHQGNPDITVLLGGRLTRVEVEIASMGERYHVIKADDAEAIAPTERDEQGYLAVLDIAEAVRWAPIAYSGIRRRLGRQPLATLHALAHWELARVCNDAFAEITIANAERLQALTFHLLRQRVLRRNA